MPEPTWRSEKRLRLPTGLVVVLIPVVIFFTGWGILHAIGAAICSSYNFISNDFCDRWHYDPPPKDALPLPDGWKVGWMSLDCGSGGCPTRVYIIEPPGAREQGVGRYVEELASRGWVIRECDVCATPGSMQKRGSWASRSSPRDMVSWVLLDSRGRDTLISDSRS